MDRGARPRRGALSHCDAHTTPQGRPLPGVEGRADLPGRRGVPGGPSLGKCSPSHGGRPLPGRHALQRASGAEVPQAEAGLASTTGNTPPPNGLRVHLQNLTPIVKKMHSAQIIAPQKKDRSKKIVCGEGHTHFLPCPWREVRPLGQTACWQLLDHMHTLGLTLCKPVHFLAGQHRTDASGHPPPPLCPGQPHQRTNAGPGPSCPAPLAPHV